MTTPDPAHTETETHPWSVNVADHPQRADSPEYSAAKKKMNEIATQATGLLYGPGPFQDHHGGALWLQDSQGWFMVRNLAGIEWSAQFCVSADMRILTADLRWIPAGEVRVGDHLAGFDESVPASGSRQWRRSVVERAEVITRPCYDVVFADGSRACATADHLWLACDPSHSGYATPGWYRTDALISPQGGARAVVKATGLWSEDTSWEAGYLAAAFDGEGHLIHEVKGDGTGHGGGQQVGIVFSQRDDEMYAEVVRCLKVLGFTFREETRQDVRQVVIAQRPQVLRFLGSIRPRRMLAQFKFEWLRQFNALERVRVTEVRYVGERPVAVLTTSTGTYIAEGLAVHNCADPAKVDLLRQNAKRLYDLVAPQIKQELDPNGLLDTPITDADGVAKWTDSIFNAGVPLHPSFHIGVMSTGKTQAQFPPVTADAENSPDAGDQAQAAATPGDQEPAGVHHYPTPIVDIQLFKYDDFQLWVTDSEGHPAAVTPVGARGSGVASVHVQYATPGSQLAQLKQQQESAGRALILPADHPLAQQAFQNQ
jgi:Family of unknown function (DUF6424)